MDHVRPSQQKEDKTSLPIDFFILNGEQISLIKPELEIVKHIIYGITNDSERVGFAKLEFADENVAELFLQVLVDFRFLDTLLYSNDGCVKIYFESSVIDERFFHLLGSNKEVITRSISIQFSRNCLIKLTDSSHIASVRNILSQFSGLKLYLSLFISFRMDIEIVPSRKQHSLRDTTDDLRLLEESQPSRPHEQPGSVHPIYLSMVTMGRNEPEKWAISDAPFLCLLANLPNVRGIGFVVDFSMEFAQRFWGQFCKRPPSSKPCAVDYRHNALPSQWLVSRLLDSFNKFRLTRLTIRLKYEGQDKVFLKKVLDVLSQSVYPESVKVIVDNRSDYDKLTFFLRGLRQFAPRMRHFRLDYSYFSRDIEPTINDKEIKRLMYIIEKIEMNSQAQSSRHSFFIMFSASNVPRIGPGCSLSMLPVDVMRHLHLFLFGTANIENQLRQIYGEPLESSDEHLNEQSRGDDTSSDDDEATGDGEQDDDYKDQVSEEGEEEDQS